MKLVFGNNDHLALAKKGEIPREAENAKTTMKKERGCDKPCEHCENYDAYYYCGNCNKGGQDHDEIALIWEGKVRCRECKFILTNVEEVED